MTTAEGYTSVLKLYDWQIEAFRAEEPSVACITPVGEGKSFTGAHWLLYHAEQYPEANYLACANVVKQIDRTVVPKLREACATFGVDYTHRQQAAEFVVHFPNGSAVIWLATMSSDDVIEFIRGVEVGKAWLDEARDMKEYAYEVVIGRLRDMRCPNPQALLTSTPKGRGWIYRKFVKDGDVVDEDGRRLRRLIHVKSRGNWRLPRGYDANLRANYDDRMAAQELGAEFVTLGQGRIYYAFDPAVNISDSIQIADGVPVCLGWDYGADPQPCIILQDLGVGGVVAVDEITVHGEGIYAVCDEFASRYQWVREVYLYDDAATGMARNPESNRVHRAIVEEGFARHRVKVHRMRGSTNPGIEARYGATNAMLRNANGDVRFRVHPRCVELITDYEDCERGKNGLIDKTDQRRTHHSDAAGYYIWEEHRPQTFDREAGYGMDAVPSRSRSLKERYRA